MKNRKITYIEKCLEITNYKIVPLENYKKDIELLHKCLVCKKDFKASARDILKGKECPFCSVKKEKVVQTKQTIKETTTSTLPDRNKVRNEVIKFVRDELGLEIVENERSIIKGKLDIYVPSKKIAIEVDNLYYNSEELLYKKLYDNAIKKGINLSNSDIERFHKIAKDYHINKTEACEAKDITLINIFEDEWNDKTVLVKKKLRYLLGESESLPKIYARKCYVKDVIPRDKNIFLDKYHIQGKDNSKIKLGLYTKGTDELVSVMTFCSPRKALGQTENSERHDYELMRFASVTDRIVIGGFSKLMKYFRDNYEWKRIITYADRRWSRGNVYLKNGWTFKHNSRPSYWYVKKDNPTGRSYRYSFRKSSLKAQFPDIYADTKTEKEIMVEAGYLRIYDCGNMVFWMDK